MRVQPLDGGSPATAHRDVGAVSGGATHASRRFAAVAPSVSEARRFLLSLLPDGCESAEAAEAADSAALILSELATNAVQHAGTDFEVAVDIAPDGRRLRVAVSDSAATFPAPQDADTEACDGRGLHIVRELADAWGIGVRRGRLGKTVWFHLLLPATGDTRTDDQERRISHQLAHDLRPDTSPPVRGRDVAARSLPAAVGVEVGGDWHDVVPITDSLVALVVGDVQGHDLGAANIMRQLSHTLERLVREEQSPGRALERLNQFCLLGSEQRLATALVGVLDRSTGTVTFSSAGHPPPLQVDGDRALELPVPPGPPLGVQRCRYKDHAFKLTHGCLVMFTDGHVERRVSFLDERLGKLEMSRRATPSGEPGVVADFVIEALTSDERSSDDIVVLTARRDAGAA